MREWEAIFTDTDRQVLRKAGYAQEQEFGKQPGGVSEVVGKRDENVQLWDAGVPAFNVAYGLWGHANIGGNLPSRYLFFLPELQGISP